MARSGVSRAQCELARQCAERVPNVEAGTTLRPTDGVYAMSANQAVLILPNTGSEEAATVAHRLVQAVRARDPDAAYGHIETQVMTLGQPHKDAASFLQALARQGGPHVG